MRTKTQDLRICATNPLMSPDVLQAQLPLSDQGAARVVQSRQTIDRIIAQEDDRLLVVAGPCSIHDHDAALEYAGKLQGAAARLRDDLFVVMRVYFEKPRTSLGWKGLINDPGLDGSFRVNDGLTLARSLLLDVIGLGLPAANEFLDPITGQYFADLISWGCIGARTVESQIHREIASGLSMPVGFKNRTDGDVTVAVDAVRAARHPHWFPSLTRNGSPACLQTAGNLSTHVVLRGGSQTGPNYSAAAVAVVEGLLRAAGLPPVVMIDCSHGNSRKDPTNQPAVAADIAAQIAGGSTTIVGAMLESFLVAGRQEPGPLPSLIRGMSVTDACMGWAETEKVLERLARGVAARRRSSKVRSARDGAGQVDRPESQVACAPV